MDDSKHASQEPNSKIDRSKSNEQKPTNKNISSKPSLKTITAIISLTKSIPNTKPKLAKIEATMGNKTVRIDKPKITNDSIPLKPIASIVNTSDSNLIDENKNNSELHPTESLKKNENKPINSLKKKPSVVSKSVDQLTTPQPLIKNKNPILERERIKINLVSSKDHSFSTNLTTEIQ